MTRASTTLRQSFKLRRALSSPSPAAVSWANNFLAPSAKLLSLPINSNGSATTKRPFHSRPSQHVQRKVRPAPTARRKREQEQKYMDGHRTGRLNGPWFNKDGFFQHSLHDLMGDNVREWYNQHAAMVGVYYEVSQLHGLLPDGITLRKFRDVATKLRDAALFSRPNAQAVRAISIDVDAVFHIGFIVTPNHQHFREWIISACAQAKARLPLILLQRQVIHWNKVPVRNESTNEIEKLARKGYPPALVLQAKILGLRHQFKEAFNLLEEQVLPYLSPTRREPTIFEDIVVHGHLDSPWRLYALLQASYDRIHNSKESRAKADEALRIAAMVYHDPEALVEYASVMMNENNLDMYEECMSKAAAAGDPNACLFLANFYYLTFHGKYPTRGERTVQSKSAGSESTPQTASQPSATASPTDTPSQTSTNFFNAVYKWTSSFFQQSMARPEYRKLAQDWYQLALRHGNDKAAFMTALLAREDGHLVPARVTLDRAERVKDAEYAQKLEALKENWYDENYVPKLPKRMLDVR